MSQNQSPTFKVLLAAACTVAALLGASLFSITSAHAHEGHSAPVKLKSKYGGMVKAGKALDLEYRVQHGDLKVWPRAHEGEALKDVKVSATVTPPRGKAQALSLSYDATAGLAIAKLDFGKAHRLAIEIKLEAQAEVQGQLTPIKETFKFQAEK
ncbi:MAG TPA: hypothetical protein PLZ57_12825 [Pseudobdellovibrionaceae bacterium]|nr:hypothetical protein [Pseudobdellovibrionaceae bacterium]